MLATKIRSLLFLVVYNYLYLSNFIDYDSSNETDLIERIIDIYISDNFTKSQLQEKPSFNEEEIIILKDFFNEFKIKLADIKLEAQKYITWDKTSFILQSILLLLITELHYFRSVNTQETTTDQKKLLTRHYLKLCQQYIDNQSVSLLHAILTKILD